MMASPISLYSAPNAGAAEGGVAAAVLEALWRHEPLRTTKSLIDVESDDTGVIVLRGNVASDVLKNMVGRLAASVAGAAGVANKVLSDSDIERRAAEALWSAGDTALYTDSLDLQSRLGTVYLGGRIAAPDRGAGEALLAKVAAEIEALPGVRGVLTTVEIVEGPAGGSDAGAAAGAAPAGVGAGQPSPSGAEELAMQERLRVWRERATGG